MEEREGNKVTRILLGCGVNKIQRRWSFS